jgi:hypothetical protein
MNPLIQLRGACYLLLFVVVCAIPVVLAQRNATSHELPATTILVTNTNDSGPGSLRDALAAANDGDTIDATGVSGTILLTSGELQINHNVTINGPGAGSLEVNANDTSRVFENFASNVTITGITIANGFTIDVFQGGGGILSHGGIALTINNSSIVSNFGGAYAGGISSGEGANLTVANSVISNNSSSINGGGIAFSGGGKLTITNSIISGNNSPSGGGIHVDGGMVTVGNSTINDNVGGCNDGGGIGITDNAQLTVMNSTISGNVATDTFGGCGLQAAYGGGIAIEGGATVTITTSTISGNVVDATIGDGGGVYGGAGTLTVTSSTISDNSAPGSGGSFWNGGTANIGDTVLNSGTSGGTIFNSGGTVTSLGYNLASDDGGGVLTGPGDQINTDPMLGPLQNNGGPTFTQALLPGSPAINAGNPSFTPPPRFDQRGPGFRRVVHGRIDIGSYEVQRRR